MATPILSGRVSTNRNCFDPRSPATFLLVLMCGATGDAGYLMKRKKPLKRTGYLKRTKPLRWQSAERKELRKKVAPLEKEFLSQFPMCVYCGVRQSTGIDHIAGGASRQAALSNRCAWNASCWECNSGDANDPDKFPIERKLAVKLTTDGEFFDLDTFNVIRRRASTAITLADVSAWLEWR